MLIEQKKILLQTIYSKEKVPCLLLLDFNLEVKSDMYNAFMATHLRQYWIKTIVE